MQPVAHNRLTYIDTWRVIAVILVIISHLAGNISPLGNSKIEELINQSSLNFLGYYAEVGVFIFFFISGFVVSKTCLDELQVRGSFSIKGFYIRRAFRIIPPLLLYLITCSVLSGFGIIQFLPEKFL
jgi:peptidoglycan/LPS O-acetylase OafA/YrhL